MHGEHVRTRRQVGKRQETEHVRHVGAGSSACDAAAGTQASHPGNAQMRCDAEQPSTRQVRERGHVERVSHVCEADWLTQMQSLCQQASSLNQQCISCNTGPAVQSMGGSQFEHSMQTERHIKEGQTCAAGHATNHANKRREIPQPPSTTAAGPRIQMPEGNDALQPAAVLHRV
jgi:hypothetical protein